MDIRTIDTLFAASTTVLVGCIAILFRRDWLTVCFAAANFFLAMWNIGDLVVFLGHAPGLQLLLYRLSYFFGVMTIFSYYVFTLAFIQKPIRQEKTFFTGIAALGVILCALTPTAYFIEKVDFSVVPFRETPGRAFPFFVLYLIICMGYDLYLLLTHYRQSAGLQKTRIKYLFLGLFFGLVAGLLFFIQLYTGIRAYFYYIQSVYGLLILYAVLKYQLMSISIVIKRTGLILAIYCVLVLLTAPVLMLTRGRLFLSHGIEILIFSLVFSLGPVIYAYFVRRSSYFHEHTMASLTHELKSPLAIIESAVDAIKAQSQQASASGLPADYIDMISRNTERLQTYVNNLLQVYKVQNKKDALSPKRINLVQLIESEVNEKKELLSRRGNQLMFNIPERPVTVLCDPEKVKQVLSNLISNANKFTDKGTITLGVVTQPTHIEISVSDTGCGIPRNDLPYIFDRFYQGQKNKTAQGTGIGLAIAKLWVEAHGGTLHATSDGEGHGSRFWFTLPQ